MLVIRKQQMNVLEDGVLQQRARTQAETHFADRAKALGPELDVVIRRAIQRARAHNFGSSVDILQFVDLAVLLGEDFENLPWARAALRETVPSKMKFRAVRLYEGAIRHLRQREREVNK